MFFIENLLLNHSGMHFIWSFLFCLPVHWWWKWFNFQYWVISTTQFVPNSNYESVMSNYRTLITKVSWPWRWRANNLDKSESPSKIFVCGVSIQQLTKHSDYFVLKNTSERVARRCDDTVDKKRVNSCVPKQFFLFGGNSATKKMAKKPWKCSFRRATNVMFENWAPRGFFKVRFTRC
jgi:hypothetical protein